MYNLYLNEKDMKENSHFPAIALFNEAANQNLIEFFRNLSNGIGGGYNYVSCYFWNELDEYDKTEMSQFEGLCIETEDNEQIFLPYQCVFEYMKITAKRYSMDDYNQLKTLNEFIEKFNNKFLKL